MRKKKRYLYDLIEGWGYISSESFLKEVILKLGFVGWEGVRMVEVEGKTFFG